MEEEMVPDSDLGLSSISIQREMLKETGDEDLE